MMWGYYTYDNPAMMIWVVLQGLFWLALAAFAVWALVRWLNRSPRGAPPLFHGPQDPSALDILKQRYARGEIDTATFEDMRTRLEAAEPPENRPRETVSSEC